VLSEAQVMTDLVLCKRCVSLPKGYTRQRHAVCDLGHFFALLVTQPEGKGTYPTRRRSAACHTRSCNRCGYPCGPGQPFRCCRRAASGRATEPGLHSNR
jgi:hypothetical protein